MNKYNETKLELDTLYTEYALKEDEHNKSLKEGLKSVNQLNKTITQKQFEIDGLAL